MDKMPECTQEYHPTTGGTVADTFESDGAPGDKDGTGMSAVTGNTEEGEYNHDKIKGHGVWPHSPADPEVGGPPLASTEGGPNYTQGQGSQAPASLPSDRINSGVSNAGPAMGGSKPYVHTRPKGY